MHNNRLNKVLIAPKTSKKFKKEILGSKKISMTDKDLRSLRELKMLSLRSNKLNNAYFELNTFSEINKLEELNLDYN